MIAPRREYADLPELVERYIGLPGGDALPELTAIT